MYDAEGGGGKLSFMGDTVSKAPGGAGGAAGYVISQTRFFVDPDEAQNLIKGLEAAVKELQLAKRYSDDITRTQSPGKDAYSGFATVKIRETASDLEGGYGWANQKAQEALLKTIQNIRDALAAYKTTESAAEDALKPRD
ncbi:hypothetical protein [Saccharothrix variisporea]|uniref:PE family protein n=1 Tax=Saccharothrix variisporea TaxID=543527 RepID=A0A495XFE6_9PSEU|nr:hypothetical protein [Saccharothrix variisporea]RKT70278.1 hypothetical protein DFJ66_3535 [Saccharothrix variisporea]